MQTHRNEQQQEDLFQAPVWRREETIIISMNVTYAAFGPFFTFHLFSFLPSPDPKSRASRSCSSTLQGGWRPNGEDLQLSDRLSAPPPSVFISLSSVRPDLASGGKPAQGWTKNTPALLFQYLTSSTCIVIFDINTILISNLRQKKNQEARVSNLRIKNYFKWDLYGSDSNSIQEELEGLDYW